MSERRSDANWMALGMSEAILTASILPCRSPRFMMRPGCTAMLDSAKPTPHRIGPPKIFSTRLALEFVRLSALLRPIKPGVMSGRPQ